jgi:hypothetical protein
MKITFTFFSIVLLTMLLYSCKPAKTIFYSYKVDAYTTDTGRHLLTSSRLISCGDYLFEFKMQRMNNMEYDYYKGEGRTELRSSTTKYDTIGVHLLANRQFIEFDTFAVNAKVIKRDSIGRKGSGFTMGDGSTVINYMPPFISNPKDTSVNNIPCYFVDILGSAISPVSDTASTKFFLLKNKNFTSLLKAYGLTAMNNEYCIVSLCYYHKLKQESYLEEIDSLRPVTAAERAICESLITKAGLPLPK